MNSIAPITPDYFSVTDTSVRTTSLKVAEAFGKRHSDVTKKIESLQCSKEFRSANFSAYPTPMDKTVRHTLAGK